MATMRKFHRANCRAAIFAPNLENRRPRWAPGSFVFALALLVTSCTGGKHFEIVAEGPPSGMPQYVVVTKATQIATLHFPPGSYPFYARDDRGYYYRSPHPILERVAGGAYPLKGGVYVLRQKPSVVRPFVYRAGALTHVGRLKYGTYEFQNEPSLP